MMLLFSVKSRSLILCPSHKFSSPLLPNFSNTWSNNSSIQITFQNNYFINALIQSDLNLPSLQFSGVYCPCSPLGIIHLWNNIDAISANFNGPWILMGGFDSITSHQEKSGGKPYASSFSRSLSSDLDNHGLMDLDFHGNPYTWNNKRRGMANIRERLDRGVANSQCCTIFSHTTITHLPFIAYDHFPIILNASIDLLHTPKPLKFEAMWLSNTNLPRYRFQVMEPNGFWIFSLSAPFWNHKC